MKTFTLLMLMSLISFNVSADNWYFSGGMAYHNTSVDAPEIQLESFLGTLEFGYEYYINPSWVVNPYISHTSGIYMQEKGYGFNPVGVKLKVIF